MRRMSNNEIQMSKRMTNDQVRMTNVGNGVALVIRASSFGFPWHLELGFWTFAHAVLPLHHADARRRLLRHRVGVYHRRSGAAGSEFAGDSRRPDDRAAAV